MHDALRQQILDEHAELRERLDEIETLARMFESGSGDAGVELRERGLAFYARFAAHLQLEERELEPVLRSSLADGAKRAERLGHEHEEQRELISYLMGRLGEQRHPTLLIARELLAFASYLRRDMVYEEQELLGALGGTSQLPGLPGGHRTG